MLKNLFKYRKDYGHPLVAPSDFRFIKASENLPDNIALINAPDIASALPQMFKLARKEDSVNFIVWTPPSQPVLDRRTLLRLRLMRSFNGFQITGYLENADQSGPVLFEDSRWKGIFGQNLIKSDLQDHVAIIQQSSRDFLKTGEKFNRASYTLHGNLTSQNSLSIVDSMPAFHIDSFSGIRYLRLLCAHQGPGTYVIGSPDLKYKKEPGGDIDAELKRKNAPVWMVPQGSYALMKSGGRWEDHKNWAPAYHSWPFQNRFSGKGKKRVFERTDFAIAEPAC